MPSDRGHPTLEDLLDAYLRGHARRHVRLQERMKWQGLAFGISVLVVAALVFTVFTSPWCAPLPPPADVEVQPVIEIPAPEPSATAPPPVTRHPPLWSVDALPLSTDRPTANESLPPEPYGDNRGVH